VEKWDGIRRVSGRKKRRVGNERETRGGEGESRVSVESGEGAGREK
jgi:hypothetical protein